MTEFPKWNIGTVNTIHGTFDVHWINQDLAQITDEGDEILSFCSKSDPGFVSVGDVIDQAEDIIIDWEDMTLPSYEGWDE